MKKAYLLILSLLLIQCSNEEPILPNDNNSTQDEPIPINFTIETVDISNISPYSFSSGCRILTSIQYFSYNDKGICWSTSPNPTINDNFISEVTNTNDFFREYINSSTLLKIKNLNPNTLYYVRGYLKQMDVNGAYITYYSNNKTFTTASIDNLYVGKNYCGGFISYLLQPNDNGYESNKPHGIIASQYIPMAQVWQNQCAIELGSNSNGPYGAGINNTFKARNYIYNSNSCGFPAAMFCYNYSANNFNDWYLPSKDELNYIKINLFANNIGGYTDGSYWSSTERSFQLAYSANFNYGGSGDTKYSNKLLIPVRIF